MAKEIEPEQLLTSAAEISSPETTQYAFATTLNFPVAAKHVKSSSSPSSSIQWQRNAKEYYTGSRKIDECFFDAHPCFDSDNDDFLSLNEGDFGSSRSFSTPIIDRIDSEAYPNTQTTTPQRNQLSTSSNTAGYPNVRPSTTSRSSSNVKKQLIEFFSESFSRDLRTQIHQQQEVEECINKQPLGSFHKYNTTPSTSTDRSTYSPQEAMSKPISNNPTTTTTNKKSAVKASCILLVRSLSCGGGGNVAAGGKKKRSRRQ